MAIGIPISVARVDSHHWLTGTGWVSWLIRNASRVGRSMTRPAPEMVGNAFTTATIFAGTATPLIVVCMIVPRWALFWLSNVLVAIADGRGVSGAQVALAWLLGRPGVTSLIVGGRTEAQIKDNLGAASLVLTPEERAKLDQISLPPLIYPYWHQVWTAKDRLGAADLAFLAPYLAG